MEFATTKKQCENKINKEYVCDYCGLPVVPLRTVDNSGTPTYWQGCYHNNAYGAFGHFTSGVPKEIYRLAYKIVLDDNMYSGMEKEKGMNFDYRFMNAVSKNARLLLRIEWLKTNKPFKTKTQLRKEVKKFYN